MNRKTITLLLALLAPAPSYAATRTEPLVPILATQPLSLRADRAYLLLRTRPRSPAPTLMRIPDDAELAAYDHARRTAFTAAEPRLVERRNAMIARQQAALAAGKSFNQAIPPVPSLASFEFVDEERSNLANVPIGKPYEKTESARTYLLEVTPGDYLFYGIGFANALHTCLCLGTVGFAAPAGRITDLGEIIAVPAAQPSDIPELAGETGLGASVNGHIALWAAAVRPDHRPLPAPLAAQPVQPADYRAIGKFVSPLAFNINRLAPIPGILGYRAGMVMDLKSNSPAPDNYAN
ncbi:hypothetical protein [Polymorphobacter sp.]|uniref:hypothetical protein n=1 Tax=Polymorphobacter sp. TaxID=1909290 RepID=UPI003F70A4D5